MQNKIIQTNRSSVSDEYRFTEETHCHEIKVGSEWKKATGITTVLGVINKPVLIGWAVNMALSHLKANPNDFEGAKEAHTKARDKAGSIGSDIHLAIDTFYKKGIKPQDELAKGHLEAIRGVISELNLTVIGTEVACYDKEWFLGGICDLILEKPNGELVIADIKTGSGIYPEHFLQMGAYSHMLRNVGYDKPFTEAIVFNCKKDGSFKYERAFGIDLFKKVFASCLDLYRYNESYKNILNKVNTK